MSNERFESIRQLGAKYWQTIVSVIVAFATTTKVFFDFSNGVPGSQTWIAIGIALSVVIVIRFPGVAVRLTRLILGSPPVPSNPPRIFRGPLPYISGETLPGRKAEFDACFLVLQQEPFFILEGESGCGKSSILNAALLPQAREKFRVAECRAAYDPIGKLFSSLLQQSYRPSDQSITHENLRDELKAAISAYAKSPEAPHIVKPVLLCIDQFEELFVTVRVDLRVRFLALLSNAIADGYLRLLIAIRNDFRDLLMSLCRTVDPTQQVLNFGAYYTLAPFSERQAIAVLAEMLEPLHEGDPLRKQVLDDFSKKLVLELLIPPRDRRLCQDDEKTALPVELQIVGVMIESVGVDYFSAEGLRRLGGKTELIRTYIEEAKTYVWRKTGVSGDQSLLVLRQLISTARTKWTRTPGNISRDLNIPSSQVQSVLDAFAEKFLVNRLPNEEGIAADQQDSHQSNTEDAHYELMHEHLVRILVEAPQPILQKARDAEERLAFWRKRNEEISPLPADEQKARRLLTWLGRVFAQPIPLIESFRLRPFATNREDQRMLWRNLRGFSFRLGSIAILLATLLLGWTLRTRSEAYQIDSIVQRVPVDQFTASAGPAPKAVIEWIKALIYANRPTDAFSVGRKIKNTDERSKAFAIISIELTKLGNIEKAEAAADESLSVERFDWIDLHSQAITSLVEVLAKTNRFEKFAAPKDKIKDYGNRTQFLASMAEGLVRAGKTSQAREIFAEAMATSNLINDPEQRFKALNAVATRSIDGGRKNDANSALAWAIVAARKIPQEIEKFEALLNVGDNYTKLGDIANSADVLNEALACSRNSWGPSVRTIIARIAEEMTKVGQGQQALDMARNAKTTFSKMEIIAATAQGLVKAGAESEAVLAFDEMKDSSTKFEVLVDSAAVLTEDTKVSVSRKLLERARNMLSQNVDTANWEASPVRGNPWEAVAVGLLRIGDIDNAIEVARSFDQSKQLGGRPEVIRRLKPLAKVAVELAEEGYGDKAYEAAKDVRSKIEASCALAAVMAAMIKSGRIKEARRLQTEVLAFMRETSDDHSGFPLYEPDREPYLVRIVVAFAEADKLGDAKSIVHEITGKDRRYEALEGIAKHLIKNDKIGEAIDTVDESDAVLRSRSLANLAVWLLDANKGQRIPEVLAEIEYGDDKSRASSALATWQARSGDLLLARRTADSCTSPSDQLSAYTTILVEYGKRRSPDLARRLKTEEETRNKSQQGTQSLGP